MSGHATVLINALSFKDKEWTTKATHKHSVPPQKRQLRNPAPDICRSLAKSSCIPNTIFILFLMQDFSYPKEVCLTLTSVSFSVFLLF